MDRRIFYFFLQKTTGQIWEKFSTQMIFIIYKKHMFVTAKLQKQSMNEPPLITELF